jgi:hypothetical protein
VKTNKPRGMQWLEDQTGQVLWPVDPVTEVPQTRHVSLRVPIELYERLESQAYARKESVSRYARQLLTDGLNTSGQNDRESVDRTIALLRQFRSHLPDTESPTPDGV